jgi:hypothetical protein
MRRPVSRPVQINGNMIFKGHKLTIGVDLGDRWSCYCVLDEAGKILLEQKVAMTPEAVKQTFSKIPRSLIAVETGTHSLGQPAVNGAGTVERRRFNDLGELKTCLQSRWCRRMGFTDPTTGGSSGLLPRFMGTCGITSGCRNSGTTIQAFERPGADRFGQH